MSVPFKYRQYFRDLYASFGGKPLTASDIVFISDRLPPPKFSSEIVDSYTSQCPVDEAGLLRFFGEGQKASGIGYDELAWGLVEGMARSNFFNNEEGGDASCDTKELRAILDPKIRPVRLDVNAIFTNHTGSGERTTIAELMLVFKAIFPANQTSFEQLFTWARASRPAVRRPRQLAVGGDSSPLGKTDDHPPAAAAVEAAASPPPHREGDATTAVVGGSAPATGPTADRVEVAAPAAHVPQDDVQSTSTAAVGTGGSGGFTQLRERFGSVAKVKPPPPSAAPAPPAPQPTPAAPSLGTSPPHGSGGPDALTVGSPDGGGGGSPLTSPAPPPPPEDEDEDDVDANAASPKKASDRGATASKPTADPGAAASDFAAYAASMGAPVPESAPVGVPVVTVSPPPPTSTDRTGGTGGGGAAPPVRRPLVEQPEASSTPPNLTATNKTPQQSDPTPTQRAVNGSPPVAAVLKEPPPLPQHVRAAMAQMTQQQGSAGTAPATNGGAASGGNAAGYRETLSLRQVQQLPPEVVDFIQQLDRQRSQLQSQLQRELDDLTDNNNMIRMVGDKIDSLKALQATPVFKGLENERMDLIHKMEQWIHVTRAGKEATKSEVSRLRQAQSSDAAAHAVYRDTLLYAAPSTTSTYTPAGTAAATAALAALNDPTPRLARFFESLSSKEREIKAQESALEKLRLLEKREKRLLAEIAKEDGGHALGNSSSYNVHVRGNAMDNMTTTAGMADERSRGGAGVPTHHQQQHQQTSRVFRMDPSILQSSASAQLHATKKQQVPSHMYFSNTPSAAVPAGVSRENPYLSRNVADRHRSSMDAGATVTRRLEDYLTGKPNTTR